MKNLILLFIIGISVSSCSKQFLNALNSWRDCNEECHEPTEQETNEWLQCIGACKSIDALNNPEEFAECMRPCGPGPEKIYNDCKDECDESLRATFGID